MRDYFFEQKGISVQRQGCYHATWNQKPVLVAAKEIANVSKHFQLRDRKTGSPRPSDTRGALRRKSQVVDVYASGSGVLFNVPRDAPDIVIRLSDGTNYPLYAFTAKILNYWRDYLASEGIRVRRQSVGELLGDM
jgi:hypothetical protein